MLRTVNPDIMLIPEIYPGIEEEATRVGADVYQMYDVIDVIAHEYEFGNGEHMAAVAFTGRLVLVSGRDADVSGLCAGQGHLAPELLVGWTKGCHRAGANEESRQPPS